MYYIRQIKGGFMANTDWKAQLKEVKSTLIQEMSDQERQRYELDKQLEQRKKLELNLRKRMLYEFLAGYKQNSGIFINNFFRKRSYQLYCEDKFHSFDFDVSGILPNVFDDLAFSMSMVGYFNALEKKEVAYAPINVSFIEHLIAVAEVFELLPLFEEDTVVYRGCSTIERNGVNGLVSTTADRRVAEQFSRGTILTIHVPKGTQCINVKSIRPFEQQKKDLENEILLPPCNYEIISEVKVERGKEPNNDNCQTNLIEIRVQPLDLLEEFLKVLENPVLEYIPIRDVQGLTYYETVEFFKKYIAQRKNRKDLCFTSKESHR
jgi:hypothetical protein